MPSWKGFRDITMAYKVRVVHAEQNRFAEIEGRDRALLSQRLQQSDIDDLKFLWCELASRVGLRSNLSAQQEQLSRMATVDSGQDRAVRAARERKRRTSKKEAMAQSAEVEWLSSQPVHIQASLAPEPKVTLVAETKRRHQYIDGCIVAHGFQPQTMALGVGQSGGRLKMVPHEMMDPWTGDPVLGLVSMLSASEVWSDRKNNRQAEAVSESLAALRRMPSRQVNVLYQMYANASPPSEFPALEDLAPLALDTAYVTQHARSMTRKLRSEAMSGGFISADDYCRDRWLDRREEVSLKTALHDLIDKRSQESRERELARIHATNEIKVQARELLIEASDAYRAAKSC
jgi:hypothetical protein